MAEPMISFFWRRWMSLSVLVGLALILVLGERVFSISLRSTATISGWILLALVIGLALFNVRKQLSFIPLGTAATWLQLHIYAGLLTIVLFGLHIQWRVPNGLFEVILALWYLAVVGSGVVGLVLSRIFPRRLTTRGEEIIFERVPRVRNRIQATVENLVLECLAETDSTAIPEFYTQQLKPFFERPRHFWSHLLLSDRSRRKILAEIESHGRYLDDTERRVMNEIADFVRVKDELDYQFAHQATLKYWLFAHVPLTYGLLVFAFFHVILVYAFSGGFR